MYRDIFVQFVWTFETAMQKAVQLYKADAISNHVLVPSTQNHFAQTISIQTPETAIPSQMKMAAAAPATAHPAFFSPALAVGAAGDPPVLRVVVSLATMTSLAMLLI